MTSLPQRGIHATLKIPIFQAAVIHFAEERNAIAYMVRLRWPDGIVKCPTCGSTDVTFLSTRDLFQCKATHPKRQFSIKVGTVLESSPIPLGKWLLTAWMLMNCRNGISSYEVARTIGVTQKSAWFMLHRLRLAMQDFQPMKLTGTVEADEAYYGGNPRNKHVRRRNLQSDAKQPIFGMVERGGRIVALPTHDARESTVLPLLTAHVDLDATLITDAFTAYDRVQGYNHQRINHHQQRYVAGRIHTNTIENFWSCLKRVLKGTYVSVTRKHLMAYVQEQVSRFNHRKKALYSEEMRFQAVLGGMVGKRLTYKQLIGRMA